MLILCVGMTNEKWVTFVETVGSIAWFAMDGGWMFGSRLVALTLAVPTVVMAMLVVPFGPRTWTHWLVNGAMATWACMNVFWMGTDLQLITWGTVAAKALLLAGALMVACAVAIGRRDAAAMLFARFRRLRLRA